MTEVLRCSSRQITTYNKYSTSTVHDNSGDWTRGGQKLRTVREYTRFSAFFHAISQFIFRFIHNNRDEFKKERPRYKKKETNHLPRVASHLLLLPKIVVKDVASIPTVIVRIYMPICHKQGKCSISFRLRFVHNAQELGRKQHLSHKRAMFCGTSVFLIRCCCRRLRSYLPRSTTYNG